MKKFSLLHPLSFLLRPFLNHDNLSSSAAKKGNSYIINLTQYLTKAISGHLKEGQSIRDVSFFPNRLPLYIPIRVSYKA